MNKELEALKLDLEEFKLSKTTEFILLRFDREEALNMLKALTPPTVDEVCKALSDFLREEISYDNKQFHYIIKNTQCLMFVTETYDNNTFSLGVYLPPHLITMIGRFYEGVEK
ncbi:MAG: hypothetical protein RBQ97_09925 [Acholeplasma sp.]|nr:hypothetical protein [Acholeplasma sp.]